MPSAVASLVPPVCNPGSLVPNGITRGSLSWLVATRDAIWHSWPWNAALWHSWRHLRGHACQYYMIFRTSGSIYLLNVQWQYSTGGVLRHISNVLQIYRTSGSKYHTILALVPSVVASLVLPVAPLPPALVMPPPRALVPILYDISNLRFDIFV